VYITISPIAEELGKRDDMSTDLTKKGDILRRRWFFADFDPVRDTNTASTEAHLAAARDKARACATALVAMGWPAPTSACSGNGMHLLWAVDQPNEPESDTLFKRATDAIVHKWGDKIIGVDKSVHNAARIIKLWETKSVKGQDTAETPHRYSQALHLAPRVIVTEEMIRAVINAWGEQKSTKGKAAPVEAKRGPGRPKKPDEPTATFDMAGWLAENNLEVREVREEGDRTRYVLECCPFDATHGGKDAAVFLSPDGQRGFHCFHDSCASRGWKDVRALFDTAYADRLAVTEGDLPVLCVNNRRAIDVLRDLVALLGDNNDPPTLFQSEGLLLTLRTSGGINGTRTTRHRHAPCRGH